ncbi:MAG TPA: phosphatase PAP2 family protein [Methanofastidiosum sp.]|nr:phosphatase PAP2 family protein [Methanofastidiosum sp.]HNU61446.1 phosphatase PAP2 family protein [Methanofastidiosum sp.]
MRTSVSIVIVNIFSLILFFVIFLEVLSSGILVELDLFLNTAMPQIRNSFFTSLSILIDVIFDLISMIVISILLSVFLLKRYCKKFALFFSMTITLDALVIIALKDINMRARPLNGIISKTDFAYPSGHTADAVVFFGFLTYLVMRKSESHIINGITISISSFMIILIGFSRLYLNVHWLTDVIGGFALGLFILTGSILLKEYTGKLNCASENKGDEQ